MAQVVITLKIMPSSPEEDLGSIEKLAINEIAGFGGEVGKKEVQPVAFGLSAILLYFVMDESKGSTEALESRISAIDGVASVDVVDVRRAAG